MKFAGFLFFICSVQALKISQEPELDIVGSTYDEECGDRFNYKCWKKGGHSLDKTRHCVDEVQWLHGEGKNCECAASNGVYTCSHSQTCIAAGDSQVTACLATCSNNEIAPTDSCSCPASIRRTCTDGLTCDMVQGTTLLNTCLSSCADDADTAITTNPCMCTGTSAVANFCDINQYCRTAAVDGCLQACTPAKAESTANTQCNCVATNVNYNSICDTGETCTVGGTSAALVCPTPCGDGITADAATCTCGLDGAAAGDADAPVCPNGESCSITDTVGQCSR